MSVCHENAYDHCQKRKLVLGIEVDEVPLVRSGFHERQSITGKFTAATVASNGAIIGEAYYDMPQGMDVEAEIL